MIISLSLISLLFSCSQMEKRQTGANTPVSKYFEYGDTSVVQAGGIRMIPIKTPVGEFKVWTKRFGNNQAIKVLLLHGGPAAGHEYMECLESFFPAQGFEFYEYDQLGAPYSDQPPDSSLWTVDRYVDEVEQVRTPSAPTKIIFMFLAIPGVAFLLWNMP
jgi:proline iminopeptidase